MRARNNNPAYESAFRQIQQQEGDQAHRLEVGHTFVTHSPEAAKWFVDHMIRRHDELVKANAEAKQKLAEVRELVEKVMADPHPLGYYIAPSGEAEAPKAIVHSAGGFSEVGFAEGVDPEMAPGQPVLLTAERNLIVGTTTQAFMKDGELLPFVRLLEDGRMLLSDQDQEIVASPEEGVDTGELVKGDHVRIRKLTDQTIFAIERIPPSKPDDLFETPKVTFSDLGGMNRQIATLKWELDKRRMPESGGNYGKKTGRTRNFLFTGPTGTGKSCLAHAMAHYEGEKSGKTARFCNVRIDTWGTPYLFETEARMAATLNAVKSAAREDPDSVALCFVDEIDWLTRHRGQSLNGHGDRILNEFLMLLSDPDWPENLLFVSATNLLSQIDVAARRRLADFTMEIPRPNRAAARQILEVYLTEELTYETNGAGSETVRREIIDAALHRLFAVNGASDLLRVTLDNSDTRTVRAADLVNGAELERIAEHAGDRAHQREYETGDRGIRLEDIHHGIDRFFESAVMGVTPTNLRSYIDDLPEGLRATRVEPIQRDGRGMQKYWKVAS